MTAGELIKILNEYSKDTKVLLYKCDDKWIGDYYESIDIEDVETLKVERHGTSNCYYTKDSDGELVIVL